MIQNITGCTNKQDESQSNSLSPPLTTEMNCIGIDSNGNYVFIPEKPIEPLSLEEKKPIAETFLRQFNYYIEVSKNKVFGYHNDVTLYKNLDAGYTQYKLAEACVGLATVYIDCLSYEQQNDVENCLKEQNISVHSGDSKINTFFTDTGLQIKVYKPITTGSSPVEGLMMMNIIDDFKYDHNKLYHDSIYANGDYNFFATGIEIYVEDLSGRRLQHTVYLVGTNGDGNQQIWEPDLSNKKVVDFYENHDRTTGNVIDDKSWYLMYYPMHSDGSVDDGTMYLTDIRLYVDGELIDENDFWLCWTYKKD